MEDNNFKSKGHCQSVLYCQLHVVCMVLPRFRRYWILFCFYRIKDIQKVQKPTKGNCENAFKDGTSTSSFHVSLELFHLICSNLKYKFTLKYIIVDCKIYLLDASISVSCGGRGDRSPKWESRADIQWILNRIERRIKFLVPLIFLKNNPLKLGYSVVQ